jgi:membrane-associated phospholipid phosphatase
MKTYLSKVPRLLGGSVTIAVALTHPILQADVVQDWNTVMQSTVNGQAPFIQARYAAITQLAVFEAVTTITKEYRPYLGTIGAPAEASADAAVIAAAHSVLKTYFPANSTTLDTARGNSLAQIPDGPAKAAGMAVGESAAAAIMALRSGDGSTPAAFYAPPTSPTAGQWLSTPSCPAAGGTFLHWAKMKPFVLRSADQFRLDAPPALTSARYTKDYSEVKAVGIANSAVRAQDRTDVARYYGATSPVAVWNPVARQLATAAGNSLSENARAFALLNMALSDAAVAVFDTKYQYNFWRPETAIRAAQTDENARTDADPSFTPLITAPCFPSFPSAHASLSGAAREVLEQLFAPRGHSVTLSNSAVPGVTLQYRKLKEITDDIDDARVYGGIHFRFDQEEGAEPGAVWASMS